MYAAHSKHHTNLPSSADPGQLIGGDDDEDDDETESVQSEDNVEDNVEDNQHDDDDVQEQEQAGRAEK